MARGIFFFGLITSSPVVDIASNPNLKLKKKTSVLFFLKGRVRSKTVKIFTYISVKALSSAVYDSYQTEWHKTACATLFLTRA